MHQSYIQHNLQISYKRQHSSKQTQMPGHELRFPQGNYSRAIKKAAQNINQRSFLTPINQITG